MKEIAKFVRDRNGGVKLGGATPQNTIVGQLSKDPTFVLVKRATYRLRTNGDGGGGGGVPTASDAHTTTVEDDIVEVVAVGEKRSAPTESAASDKSSGSELVDVTLAYEPGSTIEVAQPHKVHGATWANAKIIENDGNFVTLRIAPEGGEDAPCELARLPTSMLSSTIRPEPPVETLAVDQTRTLNEEVDVHYNNRWCEGYISQVPDARGKMTVCFPGVGVNNDTSLVVFQDSTGQSWIRETWNKTRPKRATIRKGWTLSLYGRWYPRGAAQQEFASGGPDLAYKHLAAVSMSEAGDSTKRTKRNDSGINAITAVLDNALLQESSDDEAKNNRGGVLGSFVGDSAKAMVTSDETDCAFKSISDACYHLLLTAGPQGLQVSEMVRLIQERALVKLAGKTPANTVYSRLSQDSRFVNVSRGAYALEVVLAAAAKSVAHKGQKSIADESPRRPKVTPLSAEYSTIHQAGFASATPSFAGTVSKSCMSELSTASELLLGLRQGRR